MKEFILHEVVGIDTSIGILIYLCASFFFLEKQSISVLLIALFFARFPDFGFPLYLLLRKRFDLQTHRTLTHYPVVAIPLAALLGYFLGYFFFPGETRLLTMIAFMGCCVHFIHDSWDEFGIPWFWPFKASRYRIRGKRIEEVTRQIYFPSSEKSNGAIIASAMSLPSTLKISVELFLFSFAACWFFCSLHFYRA